jgi:hypothetical protein
VRDVAICFNGKDECDDSGDNEKGKVRSQCSFWVDLSSHDDVSFVLISCFGLSSGRAFMKPRTPTIQVNNRFD